MSNLVRALHVQIESITLGNALAEAVVTKPSLRLRASVEHLGFAQGSNSTVVIKAIEVILAED